MMRLKLLVNKLAVICGSVSSDITNTIPTMRRHDTMVSAMNIMRRYSNKATGMCCERANSLSKAMAMMGLRNKPKNSSNTTLSNPSMAMSLLVIVRILPNRYDDKSGVKPGAKKLNMIPIATESPEHGYGGVFAHIASLAEPFHSESRQHREYCSAQYGRHSGV